MQPARTAAAPAPRACSSSPEARVWTERSLGRKARVAVEERDARKERKNSLTEDELETHRQVVELIAKHIEECEALEKKR